MSSDNGIYILKTKAEKPVPESDFEYRVAHVGGIENIYWDPKAGEENRTGQFTPEIAFECFGDAPMFRAYVNALEYAHSLAEEISPLEYGVCTLDHDNQVFQKFLAEDIEAFERNGDELMERRREERDLEMASRRAQAAVQFGPGLTFEPGAIHGYLIKGDGTKVHGSLSGLESLTVTDEGELGEGGLGANVAGGGADLEFLPSDWNKE